MLNSSVICAMSFCPPYLQNSLFMLNHGFVRGPQYRRNSLVCSFFLKIVYNIIPIVLYLYFLSTQSHILQISSFLTFSIHISVPHT